MIAPSCLDPEILRQADSYDRAPEQPKQLEMPVVDSMTTIVVPKPQMARHQGKLQY
jgi:hypothetical protein